MNDTIPVPASDIPLPKTPGLTFIRIISFVALFFATVSFVSFISAVADSVLPSLGFDDLNPYESIKESLPLFIASFITLIASLVVLRHKRVAAHNVQYSIGWRRFLYTLFTILGIWLLGGLMYVIAEWLDGDLALRVILKVAASLVLIAVIAGYYVGELTGTWVQSGRKHLMFIGGVSLAVAVVIVTSFAIIGSPAFHRNLKIDSDTRWNIEILKRMVECECMEGELPSAEEFDALVYDYGYEDYVADLNGKAISYERISSKEYQFCAAFAFDSQQLDAHAAKYKGQYKSAVKWAYEKNGCQKFELPAKVQKPITVLFDSEDVAEDSPVIRTGSTRSDGGTAENGND